MKQLICRTLSIIALAAAFSACSSQTIHTDKDPNVAPASLHAYSFEHKRAPAGVVVTTPSLPESLTEQRVKAAIENELATKGIDQAAQSTAPDFLVAYYVGHKTVLTPSPTYVGGPPGYNSWAGYDYTGVPRDVGSLIVDFVDPKTNKVFWHGVATNDISPGGDNSEKIKTAVKDLLAKFPS